MISIKTDYHLITVKKKKSDSNLFQSNLSAFALRPVSTTYSIAFESIACVSKIGLVLYLPFVEERPSKKE